MTMVTDPDIAPASETADTGGGAAAGTRQCRGWFRRIAARGHYAPVGAAGEQGAARERLAEAAAGEGAKKPPRRGWLRWLVPQEYAQRQRWKSLGGGGAARLAGLARWKRLPGLSAGLRSNWAWALLDAVAFRVMYVVEAVVLGLALSCFFCCCGCQI